VENEVGFWESHKGSTMLEIRKRVGVDMSNGMRYCLECLEAYSVEQLSTHRCGYDVDIGVDNKVGQKWPKKILYGIKELIEKGREIK
jgi:hypothetical protein